MKKTKLFILLAVMLFAASITNVATGQTRSIVVGIDYTSSYQPTQIANGNFDYEPYMARWGDNRIPNGTNQGWNTTETGEHCFEYLCGDIYWIPYELTAGGNCIVEMNADNEAALYQDLFTKGGDVIRWSLKHAVRDDPDNSPLIQAIRVEIGAPKYYGGDIVYPHGINNDIQTEINNNTKASYVNYGITNPSAGTYGYAGEYDLNGLSLDKYSDFGDWHNATGVYIIPENQNVTRFAFVSYGADEEEECASCGNFLDDITFSTLIGNLSAVQLANGNVELKGYWGETDDEKHLVVEFGSHKEYVGMSDVQEENFVITIPAATIGDATSLTVYHEDYEDAGRTITIHSYSQSISTPDGWYLISSPIGTTVSPSDVTNMTSNNYDIFRFNQGAEMEWQNWNQTGDHYHFDLEPGRGYLYANSSTVTLTFKGTPYSGTGEVNLEYSTANSDSRMRGWNLIGNPFSETATIDKDFYRMNNDHTELIASTGDIAPMEGVFVHATGINQTVTFTTGAKRGTAGVEDNIVINLNDTKGTVIDRAIVSFDEGRTLPKFQIRDNSTKLYIPQNGTDYAIAFSYRIGELPLNFKAKETGQYTITVETPNFVSLQGVSLVDMIDNEVIDLSVNDTYSFIGSPTDRENRFKLVFSSSNNSNIDIFAYQSGNDIVVSGEGELQVFDMMGRLVATHRVSGVETVSKPSQGVYIFRLNEKVQKIVVR